MDPAVIGMRLASSAVAPLVKKLFVQEGPGAGLVDRPVRLAGLVSFRGEKRTLNEKDLRKLADELVARAVTTAGPAERPAPADEDEAVADALARTLHCLGDLDMDDVQAVRLGPEALAAALRAAAGRPSDPLSQAATGLYDTLLGTACLHILHFFTQRSAFVPRTLVDQSGQLAGLVAKLDILIERIPSRSAEDAGFERRYAEYTAAKHRTLTIVGLDLGHAEENWPLETAYLSLKSAGRDETASDTVLPADQILSGHHRILLRGTAGSGKTTLVQWLAVHAARQRTPPGMEPLIGRVPFVLPLRTIARQDALPTPGAFLSAVHNPLHAAQPAGWADRVLSAGRGLLLVDGIDEIPERDRERTRAWLGDLLLAYPDNLWLVTSRPSAVRQDWLAGQDFAEFVLAPMSRDDIGAFVDRWHRAAGTDCRDESERAALDAYRTALHTALGTRQDLGRLATNPLMCGLICALHRARRGYLPAGRKALYDAALTLLLTRRDTERRIYAPGDVQLDEEPQTQLLQRLAYYLIRNGQAELDRTQAERVIDAAIPSVPSVRALGDAPRILRHLVLRSGLLREPSSGTVEFVHRTFQDYLGAKAAVEEGDFGLLVGNAHLSQWGDVIRMAVAHSRPRERARLLTQLLERGDQDPAVRPRVHLLAMAALEHAPDLAPEVRAEVTRRAAEFFPPASPEAARRLAEAGPLVLELLPSPDGLSEDQAESCTVAACVIGTDAAIPYLSRFRDHPSLVVRSQLTSTWGRFDTDRYFTEVVSRLAPDGLYFVAETMEHLNLLHGDGGRPMLLLRGIAPSHELRDLLTPERLTHLRLDNTPSLTDLSVLGGLRGLRSLILTKCPGVTDLSPLAELSLRSLDCAPPPPYLVLPAGLDTLTTLEQLKLNLADVPLPVRHLPRLTRLVLDVYARSVSLGRVARAFPRLRHLDINIRSSPDTGRIDLTPLADLPELRTVTVSRATVTGAELLPHITLTTLARPPRRTGLAAEPAPHERP